MKGVSVFDHRGRWLWISNEPPEVAGGKVIGKRVWDFINERDARIVREAFSRALLDREPSEYTIAGIGGRQIRVKLQPVDNVLVAIWREIPHKPAKLTNRERQVLAALCNDETTKTTARKLGIAERTVETFRRRIREKIGARGVAGMVRWAIANGICGD